MLSTTSNDMVIHGAMVGRNAAKDRGKLCFEVRMQPLTVTFDENYIPTFSISVFGYHTQQDPPTQTNYDNAMRSFQFYCMDTMSDILFTAQGILDGNVYKNIYNHPRDIVQQKYNYFLHEYGVKYFRTIMLEQLLKTNFVNEKDFEKYVPHFIG